MPVARTDVPTSVDFIMLDRQRCVARYGGCPCGLGSKANVFCRHHREPKQHWSQSPVTPWTRTHMLRRRPTCRATIMAQPNDPQGRPLWSPPVQGTHTSHLVPATQNHQLMWIRQHPHVMNVHGCTHIGTSHDDLTRKGCVTGGLLATATQYCEPSHRSTRHLQQPSVSLAWSQRCIPKRDPTALGNNAAI